MMEVRVMMQMMNLVERKFHRFYIGTTSERILQISPKTIYARICFANSNL